MLLQLFKVFILYYKSIMFYWNIGDVLELTGNWWLNMQVWGTIFLPIWKLWYRTIIEDKSSFTFEDAMAFVEGDTVLA